MSWGGRGVPRGGEVELDRGAVWGLREGGVWRGWAWVVGQGPVGACV